MKKNSEFVFLSIVAAGIVYVLVLAMEHYNYDWFDARTAGIVWACIMGVLFILR